MDYAMVSKLEKARDYAITWKRPYRMIEKNSYECYCSYAL